MKLLLLSSFILLITTLALLAADAPATQASGPKRTTASGLTIIETKKLSDALVAQNDDVVWVNYTGRFQSDGKKFDSSYDRKDQETGRPTPLSFVLGKGRVIKGWHEGIVGMKVGEKRQLIVPPALAYGERGSEGGEIPANSTLVFDVELVGIYRGE